jgi:hypothetical protein
VKVHYDEGSAIRIGPESFAGVREGAGEASAKYCPDRPLEWRDLLIVAAYGSANHARGACWLKATLDACAIQACSYAFSGTKCRH